MKKNPKSGSRRINNPFPKQPAGLGFVRGELLFDSTATPSQSHTAGQGFEVRWRGGGQEAGILQVYHVTEPNRVLWSTIPGQSFVSAAFGTDSFEESRGSFAIHDQIEILCSHQTVEQVTLAWPSETFVPSDYYNVLPPPLNSNGLGHYQFHKGDALFQQFRSTKDADGLRVGDGSRGPCVIVSGCLYSDSKLARKQIAAFTQVSKRNDGGNVRGSNCPFYLTAGLQMEGGRGCLRLFSQEQRVGVRYRLVFYESRDHQLGFSVSLEQPATLESFFMANAFIGQTKRSSVVPLSAATDFHRQVGLARSFSNRFDSPPQGEYDQLLLESSSSDTSIGRNRVKKHWLWSEAPVSAFSTRGVRVGVADGCREVSGDRSSPKAPFRRSISVADFRTYSLVSKCMTGKSSFLSELARSRILSPGEQVMQLPRLNRIQLTYSSNKGERFFGFGEQFSHFDMKGRRIPIFVQEQGIGRGDQPITALANMASNRSGGSWHTTYAPVPYYMTSQMRSLYLEGYEYSVFDLTKENAVQVQVHAGYMQGRILHGKTPAQIIEQYTAAVGRMRELPAWILKGAIVGMQGGTHAVRRQWQQLKDLNVPVAAFWLQDWVGQRRTSIGWQLWWNWEVDSDHYPGWEELVKELLSHGVRTMAYCNPMLAPSHEKSNRKRDLLDEARDEDFVVNNHLGLPYMIPNTSFDAAMVDLTNPPARAWLKNILHEMVKTGIRGWMADFGEALPLDSSLFSGEEPRVMHNKYPELWAELNREVVEEWETKERELKKQRSAGQLECETGYLCTEEEEDDDDEDKLVFFMRAGYRGSPKSSTLFWLGDQMVSWQRHDGIKSAVTGLLTGGLSGFSLNHSDIGGYCTVDLPFLRYRRTEELLQRWMELNAFSTIFRTHEGNVPGANSQFYSNETTLRHFARFAKVFNAWEFYRRQLVKEAARTGLPVVRHLFVHYPHDPSVLSITYQQFLVGREILVVPVLDEGRKSVQAYFPIAPDGECEEWEHLWTGQVFSSSEELDRLLPATGFRAWVDAPLGFPAIFVRAGSEVGSRFKENLISCGVLDKR
ncbi:hypothetical protein R1flu_000122 [Riccia fluitans]|uniref:Alpha-glucosidase n=1 Tax=Riccia fluitans TaxID=41844 RepID=A0ABD1XZK2_9MARC